MLGSGGPILEQLSVPIRVGLSKPIPSQPQEPGFAFAGHLVSDAFIVEGRNARQVGGGQETALLQILGRDQQWVAREGRRPVIGRMAGAGRNAPAGKLGAARYPRLVESWAG